jgi:hypothetical protein
VNKNRGQLFDLGEMKGLITIHPSYLLRIENQVDAQVEYARLVEDLSLLLPYLG